MTLSLSGAGARCARCHRPHLIHTTNHSGHSSYSYSHSSAGRKRCLSGQSSPVCGGTEGPREWERERARANSGIWQNFSEQLSFVSSKYTYRVCETDQDHGKCMIKFILLYYIIFWKDPLRSIVPLLRLEVLFKCNHESRNLRYILDWVILFFGSLYIDTEMIYIEKYSRIWFNSLNLISKS